jgi:hypothetical protein
MIVYKSFPIFIVISFLIFSCGKKDNDEFVDDKPVKSTNDFPEKKDDSKKQENRIDSNKTSTSPTDSEKDKKYSTFEHNYKPVATVSPLEAGDYLGKEITVKGFVADVYQSEKVAYLNFVQKFPNNPFTAVIFASRFSSFKDIGKYEMQDVEVTGRVSTFKGKPQIILDGPSQIKIVK